MKQRIITGIILIIIALLWLFVANYHFFIAGSMLVLLVGGYEFAQFVFSDRSISMNGKVVSKKLSFFNKAVYAIATLLSLSGSFSPDLLLKLEADYEAHGLSFQNIYEVAHPVIYNVMTAGAVWWVIASLLVVFYPRSRNFISSKLVKALAGYLTLIPFYFSLLFLRVQFYNFDINNFNSATTGAFVVLSVMALVWCTDSGAYFTGKAFGKHKMSPNVSPNKTIEGLCGGIILAMVAFVIIYFLGGCRSQFHSVGYNVNLFALSIAALATIIISVFGDLAESLFKRESGIKDSGIIFPGHGGMLDRIDSLSAALPVFVVVYSLLM